MNPLFFLGRVGAASAPAPVDTPSVGGGLPRVERTEGRELGKRFVRARGYAVLKRTTCEGRAKLVVRARGRATFMRAQVQAYANDPVREVVQARGCATFRRSKASAVAELVAEADVELAELLGLSAVAADFR